MRMVSSCSSESLVMNRVATSVLLLMQWALSQLQSTFELKVSAFFILIVLVPWRSYVLAFIKMCLWSSFYDDGRHRCIFLCTMITTDTCRCFSVPWLPWTHDYFCEPWLPLSSQLTSKCLYRSSSNHNNTRPSYHSHCGATSWPWVHRRGWASANCFLESSCPSAWWHCAWCGHHWPPSWHSKSDLWTSQRNRWRQLHLCGSQQLWSGGGISRSIRLSEWQNLCSWFHSCV